MHVLTSRNKKSKENKVTAYQSIEEARAYIQRATNFITLNTEDNALRHRINRSQQPYIVRPSPTTA